MAPIPSQQQESLTEAIDSSHNEGSIHLSKTSQETLNDKILRLIKNVTEKQ